MRPTIDKEFFYPVGDPILWVTKHFLNR
jgi:hypothetical protein